MKGSQRRPLGGIHNTIGGPTANLPADTHRHEPLAQSKTLVDPPKIKRESGLTAQEIAEEKRKAKYLKHIRSCYNSMKENELMFMDLLEKEIDRLKIEDEIKSEITKHITNIKAPTVCTDATPDNNDTPSHLITTLGSKLTHKNLKQLAINLKQKVDQTKVANKEPNKTHIIEMMASLEKLQKQLAINLEEKVNETKVAKEERNKTHIIEMIESLENLQKQPRVDLLESYFEGGALETITTHLKNAATEFASISRTAEQTARGVFNLSKAACTLYTRRKKQKTRLLPALKTNTTLGLNDNTAHDAVVWLAEKYRTCHEHRTIIDAIALLDKHFHSTFRLAISFAQRINPVIESIGELKAHLENKASNLADYCEEKKAAIEDKIHTSISHCLEATRVRRSDSDLRSTAKALTTQLTTRLYTELEQAVLVEKNHAEAALTNQFQALTISPHDLDLGDAVFDLFKDYLPKKFCGIKNADLMQIMEVIAHIGQVMPYITLKQRKRCPIDPENLENLDPNIGAPLPLGYRVIPVGGNDEPTEKAQEQLEKATQRQEKEKREQGSIFDRKPPAAHSTKKEKKMLHRYRKFRL